MELQEHENYLNELNGDVTVERRNEILLALRTANNESESKLAANADEITKINNENIDLLKANSKLFLQAGVTGEKKSQLEIQETAEEQSKNITLKGLVEGEYKSYE